MRLLIDTHILIWADQPARLIVQPLPATMRDETNELVVSAASIWDHTGGYHGITAIHSIG